MPRKRLSVRKIKEVLRLKWGCGQSNRAVAVSCGIGTGTVCEYIRRAKLAELTWPLPPEIDDADLERRLFPPPSVVTPAERPVPDFAHIHRELRRKSVTLLLLWMEYHASYPNGYGYSRFCELYRQWSERIDPRMRQVHRAGEKVFVDYAGQTVPIVDRHTGVVSEAQVFVAALGASSYTFAEATWTQGLEDWIGSHVRAFEFFGGVPEVVVPDNLKSGVTAACYYEPEINPTYTEMAGHYGAVVLPARVKHPRDKPKVENAVQQVERWVLAVLRNRTFFSLDELNHEIRPLLNAINARELEGMKASRQDLYEALDRPALQPLPSTPYESARWKKARVHVDYHVDARTVQCPDTCRKTVTHIGDVDHSHLVSSSWHLGSASSRLIGRSPLTPLNRASYASACAASHPSVARSMPRSV